MLKVFIDGSIGPKNPGQIASYGFVVRRNDEDIARERGLVVRSDEAIYTNNVAEYGALIAFFKWYWIAYEKGLLSGDTYYGTFPDDYISVEAVLIHSDSQLLVNQINGKWSASRGVYLPYYTEAKQLFSDKLHKFIIIKWIPREENTFADELSKYHHYL